MRGATSAGCRGSDAAARGQLLRRAGAQAGPVRRLAPGPHRRRKPELGVSQAFGRWTVELAAGVTWFTRNDEFFNGNTREQDPLYSAQVHVTRQLGRGAWGAFSATYYDGGRNSDQGASAVAMRPLAEEVLGVLAGHRLEARGFGEARERLAHRRVSVHDIERAHSQA